MKRFLRKVVVPPSHGRAGRDMWADSHCLQRLRLVTGQRSAVMDHKTERGCTSPGDFLDLPEGFFSPANPAWRSEAQATSRQCRTPAAFSDHHYMMDGQDSAASCVPSLHYHADLKPGAPSWLTEPCTGRSFATKSALVHLRQRAFRRLHSNTTLPAHLWTALMRPVLRLTGTASSGR